MQKDSILEHAFILIGQLGWTDFKVSDLVSKKLDIRLGTVRRRFGSKEILLKELMTYVDAQMFLGVEGVGEEVGSSKDYLFELLMTRLEVLRPYKRALRSLWRELPCDLFGASAILPEKLKSVHWMLEWAGIDLSGAKSTLKTALFSVAYWGMMSAWLKEATEDDSKEMALVDRTLEKVLPYL